MDKLLYILAHDPVSFFVVWATALAIMLLILWVLNTD